MQYSDVTMYRYTITCYFLTFYIRIKYNFLYLFLHAIDSTTPYALSRNHKSWIESSWRKLVCASLAERIKMLCSFSAKFPPRIRH